MCIVKMVQEEVKRRCESESNYFGIGVYNHIESVAKNAVELAKLYNADVEVCELAGWLHDIASITDYKLYEKHHIYGAEIAEEILKSYNYPQDKIEAIKLCILNHRGSVVKEKQTIEEICVADADSISHYDNIAGLFYLAFVQKGLTRNEGVKFVRNKLLRSYNKMSEKSKEYYKSKKEAAELLLT